MNNEETLSDYVKSVASVFKINPELEEIHEQLSEVTRRIERIEQRLPSSWIPQYRVRNDPDYKPLGKVLDQVFDEIDNFHDKMSEVEKNMQEEYAKALKKLDQNNAN